MKKRPKWEGFIKGWHILRLFVRKGKAYAVMVKI